MAPPEINGGDHLLESGLLAAAGKETVVAAEETSSGRKKSEASLLPRCRASVQRRALAQLKEVFLGTKLFPLFSAVALAVAAESFHLGRILFYKQDTCSTWSYVLAYLATLYLFLSILTASRYFKWLPSKWKTGKVGAWLVAFGTTNGRAWVFAFSLIGLAPLAERVSFLSEHIANTAGPTAGGLLNATCGNVPELIIALFALHKEKMEILKWSLLGSILSNLLLVLGSSLLFGGLANIGKERPFDRRQADVSIGLLLLGVLCHVSTVASKYAISSGDSVGSSGVLELSRASATVMLIAYFGGLLFQLKTHRQIFEQEEDSSERSGSDDDATDASAMGFASAVVWLIGMTAVIAMLSNYIVTTIEEASESLGIPVRFISIIVLPIVGNAAEHAGAVIFAFKNKIDITLGIALGSASQISMLVVPIVLIVSWMKGISMILDFNLLETGSLVMTVITTAFTLQDNKWHYLKGFNLVLCYVVIAVCFFVMKAIPTPKK